MEIHGWLKTLNTDEWYFVSMNAPNRLQKTYLQNGPNPNWSGWEAVKLMEPLNDGRRPIIFNEANRKLSEDNAGNLSVKTVDWNGDFELFIIAEQPTDWKVALVFRRHGDTIKQVLLFVKA